jgi:hypothetical protein
MWCFFLRVVGVVNYSPEKEVICNCNRNSSDTGVITKEFEIAFNNSFTK